MLVLTLQQHRPFDAAYRAFVQLLTDSISGALDGAHQRTVELGEYRRIADTLQAAMVKPSSYLPDVAARYVPAVGNLAVGGDWYDVVDLGGGRTGLVVGDCVGHGLDAATAMAQLRSATQAMLFEGHDPATLLDRLDVFAASVDGAYCTTMVCAIVDAAAATLVYSRAGHPPPALLDPDGVTWLDQATGPPLAVRLDASRLNVTVPLTAGDTIVLYSDGLIERRGESLDVGLDRLARTTVELHGSSVQDVADGLLRTLVPERNRDDVVLVVKRFDRRRR